VAVEKRGRSLENRKSHDDGSIEDRKGLLSRSKIDLTHGLRSILPAIHPYNTRYIFDSTLEDDAKATEAANDAPKMQGSNVDQTAILPKRLPCKRLRRSAAKQEARDRR
jgi:hypothetical protein